MNWFGTDMIALGCILGGAAVGGAATLVLANGGGHADMGCGVEAMAVSQRIAISHGREARAFVVTPNIRVHAMRDCMTEADRVVEIHLDNHLEHLDAQLEQLDQTLELQMQQLEFQLQSEMGQRMEARIQFEEAMRQVEEARVKVVVKRVEGGSI